MLVVFATASAITLFFVDTMSGEMRMPGDWTMSMMWMAMPGQGALAAAAMFVLMWIAMMVAMMLPSALPMLLVYRRVMLFRGESHLGLSISLVGAGYFGVWAVFGIVAYGIGLAIARSAMAWELASRLVPIAAGIALVVAGMWQLTPWKFACLKHCRDPLHVLARHAGGRSRGALGFGVHHGWYCAGCCWGLMLMLLVIGTMNLMAMILAAAVIAAEKLLVRGEAIARGVGVTAIGAGAWLAARSLV
jgi:predicted metal-binding membrane protein